MRGRAVLEEVRGLVERNRGLVRLSLAACAHCSFCAESCFKFRSSGGDPTYMPSYKVINTIGKIVRRGGRIPGRDYEAMAGLVWGKCALCMRCRCPVGVDLPFLVSLARAACRAAGIEGDGSPRNRS